MNAAQRKRRAESNAITERYEKTPNGMLMRTYRNMKSRVLGIQKKKAHLYAGKFILPKIAFYEWAKNSQEFMPMFETWKASGYDQRLTPTVDRRDPSIGYTPTNMRWLTNSENSRAGSLSRWSK